MIELLTVVMIIAILTSIAVPQYRRTVQRSQATEGLMNLRSIFDSAARYKAQNSEVPQNLQGLDVGFFDALQIDAHSSAVGEFLYTFGDDGITACRLDGNANTAEHTYCFTAFYNNPTYGGRGAIVCQANSSKYEHVCPAFGEADATNPAIFLLDSIGEDRIDYFDDNSGGNSAGDKK